MFSLTEEFWYHENRLSVDYYIYKKKNGKCNPADYIKFHKFLIVKLRILFYIFLFFKRRIISFFK